MGVERLVTPALLLDMDRMETNIRAMQTRADTLGVRLRPHAKTHKSAMVAQRQAAAGARGLTVATLPEAEYFAAHGFTDILWAFPFPPSRLSAARALADRITLRVTVDDPATVDTLARTGFPWRVWLKVDCGYHRAGVDPQSDTAITLARHVADRLTLEGIVTHSGHSYEARTRTEREAIAESERDVAAQFRERLAGLGLDVEASVGSTPAMTAARSLAGVQEMRPGNYVFFDGMQTVIGSCEPEDIAVTVLATVVSAPAGLGHVVIDAGALALSKDLGTTAPPHYGTVLSESGGRLPGAVVTSVSQEHGLVSARLPVGTPVRVVPNHSCLTVACFDEYVVLVNDEPVDRWPIDRHR
ncbi:MAG: alanine racemase [Gemmatimonadales bacterium]